MTTRKPLLTDRTIGTLPKTWAIAADYRDHFVPGEHVYAAERYSEHTGRRSVLLSRCPFCKNLGGGPCVDDWCGTTNNISVWALGIVEVTAAVVHRDDGREVSYRIRTIKPPKDLS